MNADQSGDASAAVDTSHDSPHDAPHDDGSPKLIDVAQSADHSEVRHEVVFVDAQIEQHSELMDALRESSDPHREIDIVVLDANRDGIEQITEALAARHDVDAVHVLSHGTDGALKLGGTWLHEGNLGGYAGEIAQWHHSLSSGADLLVYGCDLAASVKGQFLIEALQTLTGADVAASTDSTGAARLGGDWDLEVRLGSIETHLLGDRGNLANWDGSLAAFSVTNTNDSGAGSLRQAITNANALSGLDTITFNISGSGPHTITLSSALPTITDSVVIDGWSEPGFSSTPVIVLDGNDVSADGLTLSNTADGSTIRGLVIRNFNGDGIEIASGSDNNTIVGNYIGHLTNLGADAGAGEANSLNGINILGANNTIGGTTAGWGNVLSGNNDCGLTITGVAATGNIVQGNFFGTNAAGTAIIANSVDGILIDVNAANNTIGGTTASARNIISGNVDDGIELDRGASGNIIRGNYIGTDITGTVDLGNQSDGILVNASTSNNQIGGTATGAGNVIAFNDGIGVDVLDGAETGNSVLGNSIHSSGALGIDLDGNGVTANDSGDGDTGPNNLQNYPTLTTARTDDFSTVTVSGTLNSTSSSSFRVEFFASSTTDASGHGEGERYLGFATVTTDGSGNASFSQTLAASVVAGEVITATATNSATGDTSEFSSSVGIHGIVVSPTSGLITTEDGGAASFSVVLSLAPTANVTVNISSSDTTEGTASATSLTFTTANWNVAQTVTVTGVSDFLTDGNVAYSIVTSAASSADANYNNRNPANVSVTNQDGVNDAPVNSVPGSLSTNINTAIVLSSSNGNPIYVSDVDAGTSTVRVTLSETNGTLTLATTSGLVFTSGDGTSDASMTFTGTIANINTALDGLAFTPANNYVGTTTLQVTTNDLGNSGSGGAQSDADSVTIEVVVEERVNTTKAQNQVDPAVAMDADGDYVVVWTSDNQDGSGKGIFAQRYDETGAKVGTEFRVNTTTAGDQVRSAVAMDATGDFVVTWASNNQDGDKYGVYAQRFNSAGVAQGSEFLVNVTTTGQQDQPQIAMDSNGDFVIVWKSDSGGTSNDIYARRFNSTGVAQSGEFRVNTSVTDTQDQPTIAMDGSGDFIVAWKTNSKIDGSGKGVFAQRYDSAGVAQGGEFQVNMTSTGDQDKPTAAMNSVGDFVIAWKSGQNQDGDKGGIFGQRFNAAGVAQGAEFQVNTTTTDNQDRPTIGIDGSGNFTVAWASNNQDGSGKGIYAQRFLANGTNSGSEFRVNSTTSNNQDFPALAMSSIGDLVVAWQGNGAGDNSGIFEHLYRSTNDAPVNSVPSAQSVNEDSTLIFSSGNGNQISTSDVDATSNPLLVTLTGSNGAITLSGTSGLTFSAGDGTADSTMTFTGTLSAINAALNGLSFAPTANFNGAASLSITTNDQGNSGLGGPLSDSDSVAITVNPVNDPLTITSNGGGATAGITLAENTTTVTTVTSTDIDGGTPSYSIVGGVDAARFSINSSTGVLTFSTAPDYEAPADSGGNNVYDVTVQASDGAGGTDTQALAITITPVNDNSPVVTSNGGGVSASISIAENSTAVTTVTATDADLPAQTLTYSITGGADAALFVIDGSTGALSFLAAPNREAPSDANGDSIYLVTVRASDGTLSDTQALSITVSDVDEFDATAISDTNAAANSVAENSAIGTTVGVTAFASDADATNNAITYSLDDNASGRFAIDGSTGVVTVAGAIDRETAASLDITVRATSADGSFSTQAFTIAVSDVNEFDTTAISDSNAAANAVNENAANGTPVGISVSASDADATNNAITYSLDDNAGGRFAVDAATGVVTVADGSLLDYESATSHTITARATSSDGSFSTTVFTIAVLPVNDNVPVAADDSFSVNEDGTLNVAAAGLLTNDSDGDGDPLTAALVTGPSNGSLVLNSDGSFAYTPNADFFGTDTFTYRANDGVNNSNIATVTITVAEINDAPVANDDAAATNEDNVASGNVLTNDTDADNLDGLAGNDDTLTATLVTGPTNGSLVLNADGSWTYTPNANFFGSDSFTYRAVDSDGATSNVATVAIAVNEINDAPVANDDVAVTTEDTPVSGNVLTNDSDTDNLDGLIGNEDTLSAVLVSGPTNGSVVLNADGSWTYSPNADFNGSDSFAYQALDSRGAVSNIATVSLVIGDVNDAPVNNAPGTAIGDEDASLVFSAANGNAVTVSDVDVGGGLLGVRLSATHGTLTLGSTTNLVFVLGDGNADQDMIFAGTPAELNAALDGLTFTPDPNYNGSASIEITTRDMGNSGTGGELTDTDTIGITVRPVNDVPVATSESYSVSPSTPLAVAAPGLLSNDSDIDGDPLQVVLVTGPSFGSIVIAADGSFVYTPQGVPFETDSFSYRVTDGQGNSNVAVVTITMSASGPIVLTPTDPDEPPAPTTDHPPELGPPGVAILPPASLPPTPIKHELDDLIPWGTPGAEVVMIAAPEFTLPTAVDSNIWINLLVRPVETEEIAELDSWMPEVIVNATSAVPILEFSLGGLNASSNGIAESEDTQSVMQFDGISVGTTVVSTFSVGYVLWTLRGGHLLTTFLATMPAWRLMDPLPVLQSFAASRDEDDEDDGGLAEIVRQRQKTTLPKPPQAPQFERQA